MTTFWGWFRMVVIGAAVISAACLWVWRQRDSITPQAAPAWAQESKAEAAAPEPKPEPAALWLGPSAQEPGAAQTLEMRWKKKIHRVPDTMARRKIVAAADRILGMLDDPDPAQVKKAAAELRGTGYELKEYLGDEGHWLILKAEGEHAGAGYYLLRTGKLERELVLQAPHAIYDVHTDVITREAFRSLPVRAAFLCDYQRYGGKGNAPDKDSLYDFAHNPDTLFQDLTVLWMQRRPDTVVVQPHAFAPGSVRDKTVDIILSPGTRRGAGPVFVKMIQNFSKAYPKLGIRVYPNSIRVLGGTTNIQGKVVRQAGGEFIHIELSESLRRELKRSQSARVQFGRTLMVSLI